MSKKTLINEVLPAPGESPTSSVRDRVLRNARRVLTNGAVASGAFVTACYAVVDPLPDPCPTFSKQFLPRATATVEENSVTIEFSSLSGWNGGWFVDERTSAVTNIQGGQLTSHNYETLKFTLDEGAPALSFDVVLRCQGPTPDPVTLSVRADLTTGIDGGRAHYPPVALSAPGFDTDGGP